MRDRCNNPNAKNYNRYGGRGITYSPEWESFSQFYADMGERPEGLTLDRIDNDRGYTAENCRWGDVPYFTARAAQGFFLELNTSSFLPAL